MLQQKKVQQMNILEAINQKSFDSNLEKVVVNLIYTHNWYRDKYKNIFEGFGIKSQHYNVLRILKGRSPEACSPGEIKEVMLDKAPDLTRLLDKLVNMGFVDRHLCPNNRRKMDVLITKQGEGVLTEIAEKQEKIRQEEQGGITEAEAGLLSDLLDKFRS